MFAPEDVLQCNQVFLDSLFGISLHPTVDGGVDFQSVGVDVVGSSIGFVVFVAPVSVSVVVVVVSVVTEPSSLTVVEEVASA